jgi:hypothetical protein
MMLPSRGSVGWSVGLLALCVAWGTAMNSAIEGPGQGWEEQLGVGLGWGGTAYVLTGLGAAVAYVISKSRTTMLITWLCLALVLSMALGVGTAYDLRRKANDARTSIAGQASHIPHPSRSPAGPVSVDDLLAEYKDNQFAAAMKYETDDPYGCLDSVLGSEPCRRVEAFGIVDDLARDHLDVAYIRFATSRQYTTVQARFSGPGAERQLAEVRRGQRVSVQCRPLYDSRRELILTDCSIAPTQPATAEGGS